jgi:hypothetical protein
MFAFFYTLFALEVPHSPTGGGGLPIYPSHTIQRDIREQIAYKGAFCSKVEAGFMHAAPSVPPAAVTRPPRAIQALYCGLRVRRVAPQFALPGALVCSPARRTTPACEPHMYRVKRTTNCPALTRRTHPHFKLSCLFCEYRSCVMWMYEVLLLA